MRWPKNIFQCIRPAFYVSKLAGLGPFTVSSTYCRNSPVDLIWSVGILMIFGIHAFIGLTARYVFVDFLGIITEIVDLATGIFSSINLVVCIGAGCFHRQKIMDTINELQCIGTNLEKLRAPNVLTSTYKHAMIYQVLASFCAATFAVCLIVLQLSNEVASQKVAVLFSYEVPVIVSLFVDIQFCTFVMLLKKQFGILNKIMGELVTDSRGDFLFKPTWRTVKFIETTMNDDNDISATILKVRMLHLRLSAASIKLNQAYSLQLLTMSVQAFVVLTTYSFYELQYSLLSADPVAVAQYFLYDLFILLYASLQLLLIVTVCHGTTNEASKIARLINVRKWYSKHSRKQIARFSDQLKHNKVEFTACNIFAFNCRFILVVVAAGASYLVILMQFEMSRNYKKMVGVI